MTRLFGTDGVRGVAGEELTGELAYALGCSVVTALREDGEARPQVLVGRDTRASGEFLEAALSAGICSAGGDTLVLGVIPTPAVAFLTSDLGAAAGAVISASHNPAADNGIKFFGASGYKFPDALERRIEELVEAGEARRAASRELGRIHPMEDAGERYVTHLVVQAGGGRPLGGLRVVVDCANGAASWAGPELLRRLGAEVTPIHDAPDGWNINDRSGATHPDVVGRAVADLDADAGIAHDGDADRALFADHLGREVNGDQVLAACALDMDGRGILAHRTVVTTVMANLGFRKAMAGAGVRMLETDVGDRYVLEEMERSGAVLGGEQSGHVIFRRHATTGDGLLTAMKFLTLACERDTPVAELAACMETFPQVLVNVPVANRQGLARAEPVWRAVRRSEQELGDSGRVLVRPSGTEPLVRVMVEADTAEKALRHANALASVVREGLARA
jgi:phosphoglucosamine mutase